MKNNTNKNKLVLPVFPTEGSLQLLLRARLMIAHATEHASLKTDFDNMIAVLGYDSAVEYLLRIIATHLDLESLTGKTFANVDIASLAGEIDSALRNHAGVHLPCLAEIKLLRQTRNLVQHGVVAPNAELKRFGSIVQKFANSVLTSIFGLPFEELRISSVVCDPAVKAFLKKAEICIDNKEWLKAIVATRDAFENEYFNRIKMASISIALYPSIVHAEEKNDISSYSIIAIKEELELNYLGINDSEYRRYKEYTKHVPREFRPKDSCGYVVMQRPWQKEDAEFCYSYVARTILKWQALESEKLYVPKIDNEYKFEYKIDSINLDAPTEHGMTYFYGADFCEELKLFYTNQEIKKALEKIEKNKKTEIETKIYIDGKLDKNIKETIRIKGMNIFLVTNNPERWGVVVWYELVD